MPLTPGTHLDSYEVVSLLGAGGMGEVYRALDTRLGRQVAIKVLPADVANDPVRLARFEQEARAAAALNHPNILALYDVSVKGDVPYIVTELLEGATLATRLAEAAGGLAVRRAIEIVRQLALGLAAAHARGIVHRDVKPANVFVTNDGHEKILDFGLAKEVVASRTPDVSTVPTRLLDTSPGQMLGTVGYMAPEQVRGRTLTHAPTCSRVAWFCTSCSPAIGPSMVRQRQTQ